MGPEPAVRPADLRHARPAQLPAGPRSQEGPADNAGRVRPGPDVYVLRAGPGVQLPPQRGADHAPGPAGQRRVPDEHREGGRRSARAARRPRAKKNGTCLHPRWVKHMLWLRGLAPEHCPTWFDLFWLSASHV